ncbi:MAG: beta-ketoacyl-[acyl-carrier-protein] synthase family protein [Proteobacteria bacterium]|nr:beta-ketoacyl-[acyl-carrier-protein] synthase family protein [Pseudomonadota bacterium]MBU1595080.1 beta-ketoacyl-[acyl-carrier-protein] synthase family protein [Pseudomonadota bacterium]
MTHAYEVAITGIGLFSVLGRTPEHIAKALRLGRSGIVVDPERSALGFASPLTGLLPPSLDDPRIGRKQRKTMPDFAFHAAVAALDALEMCGLDTSDWRNDESGLVFGCDSSCLAAVDQVSVLQERGRTELIGSGAVFRSMTSSVTMNLNTLLGTRGACWTISSACSSGGHAVGQAFDLISSGRQERVLCGGAQEVNWQSMCGFDGLGAFSCRVDEPTRASRPFDKERDGLVPSGGAAALVLERLDIAKARGARIWGRVCGYGFSSDGEHISVPSVNGLARAGAKAIRQAGLTPADIDYVCAHATSTSAGDAAEAANILSLFSGSRPAVSSIKSMTGHELWMSGASQVAYCALMASECFTAPNANLENLDPAAQGLNVISEALGRPPRNVVCNAAGFGGTNSCLVLRF